MRPALLISLLLAISSLPGLSAEPFGGGDSAFGVKEFSAVALVDRETVRPGESFRVAVVLKINEGWHVYANPTGPGRGLPVEVAGTDKDGFTFSPARYPPGKKESQEDVEAGAWVYAYEGDIALFLDVRTGAEVAPGSYTLVVSATAQACKGGTCKLPETEDVSVTVTVAEREGDPTFLNVSVFAAYETARPAPPAERGTEGERKGGGTSKGEGEAGTPDAVDIVAYRPRSLSEGAVTGLWTAIIFGFIAGVILNVMPCVLPVIGIKIMSLVSQAHEDRGRVFRLGLAFGAGILVVFLFLAALMAGFKVGWGELFQSETFLIAMIAVVFVFALGLFDIYPFGAPAIAGVAVTSEGYVGSFLKGVLSTFLATPCSGPFLGATLAWLLTQKPIMIFSVFTSVGLGMAAPYIVLSANPRLVKFVPKPGPWMETFKHVMAFVLLGTVVYLFGIVRHEMVSGMLAFCLALAFAAYLWGRYAHGGMELVARWLRRAVIAGLVVGAGFLFLKAERPDVWESFSLAALEESRVGGQTIMIDFTADWCPNCKFVEKFRLETETVRKALTAKGVRVLKADITHAGKDAVERRFMRQLGTQSLPFLAVFPADAHYEPFILRDIYSTNDVLEILGRCPDDH